MNGTTTTSSMKQRTLYDQQLISSTSDEYNYEVHNEIDQSDTINGYTLPPSMSHNQWIPNITHNRIDQSQSEVGGTLASLIIGNQWISSIDNCDDEVHTNDTHCFMDQSQRSLYQPINSLCLSVLASEDLDDERFMSLMSDIDFGTEHDQELRDRIMKQKKTSSFGFSALQRRIEKVKHDLFNLTNKLNTNYSVAEEDLLNGSHCYYNLGIGSMMDEEGEVGLWEGVEESVEKEDALDKSWKCPSQFNNNNPFSELSESTQKILGRLNLKEEVEKMNDHEEEEEKRDEEDEELEMEEDELEFTFSNRQSSMLNSFVVKGGALPVIEEGEEEEELEDSSASESEEDEETESAKYTVIERRVASTTPKSDSLHSFDITDSDPFVTPLSSFRVCDQKILDNSDDTEEYFSDFAKCSVSSSSSRESLKSQEVDKMEVSCTETTIKADQNHPEDSSDPEPSLEEKCCTSISPRIPGKEEEDEEFLDSGAEYDSFGWSTEDIRQSVEQSDSLYDKPTRSMLKSSFPDLLESSCSGEGMDLLKMPRQYNKSTDLDELLDQGHTSATSSSRDERLSQSMCNLFSSAKTHIRPDDFFQERASFDNLLETDLDSGYVSLYQPVKETEILPRVDFSCSMVNVNQAGSPQEAPLIHKLRRKAGSVQELRVADSLSRLNIPDWLNLREDEDLEEGTSLPSQRCLTSLDRTQVLWSSSQRRLHSLSRDEDLHVSHVPPVIHSKSSMVLPSQLLRQASCSRKLSPIKVCQARLTMLLPDKVTIH